ncbi:hypothetical protein GUITHDRAFT_73143 [Guillardia theta CCMP2712]|uniref:protein-tyrosine-phosphatase n=1 Tax=Guillardia theta (strain CCMP2712) TaxID=905079 RepID=L1J4L2_GUITC|nr:hypothetical protein GUITHDRAFT_73143 [Guillardia theta CCMP2712]EKX43441.1 hypothetical protein GUITHDRAFT_73143 [Guillardia theta CCMP2712]|eukprot:XP_005830421.1 hypothetical protein GUITHDRAFT_73143 [Guillardia theta CCMP2712]
MPGKLYFTIHKNEGQTKLEILKHRDIFFFSSTHHEAYIPFCHDFGPVNLAEVYLFCKFVEEKLLDPRLKSRKLVYYAEKDPPYRTNAAFLLGAFLVIVQRWSPDRVAKCFSGFEKNAFIPFQDATYEIPSFTISLLDCFKGLRNAMTIGWFNYHSFEVQKYQWLDNPANFDAHFVCPKFLAFRGPNNSDTRTRTIQEYSALFKKRGISAIIRLNEPTTYDREEFISHGLRHYDLYFDDCTTPPRDIIDKFFDICDSENGTIAIHCLAGLGRTGTLVALWVMKNLGWGARETIAWLRINRPGSVIGKQQQYLVACEQAMIRGEPLPEVEEEDFKSDALSAKVLGKQVSEASSKRRLSLMAPHLSSAL